MYSSSSYYNIRECKNIYKIITENYKFKILKKLYVRRYLWILNINNTQNKIIS